jgi:serine/threonine protein kinase
MPTAASAQANPNAKKPPSPKPSPSRISSSGDISGGRFAPGEMLAERYRILGRLGRGGMGEVYRADDLTLGQPVALKFLPEASAQDSTFIERFRAEVRNARGVSHPNVCRVYDIGEVGGLHFISMEYVDGEDLATLLRRIGRLPGSKGLEIARQLCAGLAAAHDKGVLHRDLKPANIMIDGQGRARITDFGLAVRTEEGHTDGQIAGTPAYMSPEQLEGKGATAKSDIYALGLVLYEVFTGKKAFEGSTLADFRRKHSLEQPAQPSSIVVEIDPAVERVILRCLEKDPRARPASALAVSAALPGGDPLAAALAAGETPSPELVAAAGETEGFKPRTAVACLAIVIAGIAAAFLLQSKIQMTSIVPLQYAPEALAAKASDLISQFGYTTPPVDTALLFDYDDDYLRYIADHDQSTSRWEQLKSGNPSPIYFWYRTSPRYLETDRVLSGNYVTPTDPERNISGMTYTVLDPSGRLQEFEAVPPQLDQTKAVGTIPDWTVLFKAAGLDITQFKTADPEWTSPNWGDARAAWVGAGPARPDVPLRVEAAAYRGKSIYFKLVWPWTRPARMQAYQRSAQAQVRRTVALIMFFSVLIGAILLAHRSLRLGRGDRRGAFRLAVFVLVLQFVAWALNAHHVPTAYEFGLFIMGTSLALFFAAIVWLLYIGLEPYVRRRWPTSIISWSRVLAGQFRDPLVGRHVLTGVALGIAYCVFDTLQHFAEGALGKVPPQPWEQAFYLVRGTGGEIGHLIHDVTSSLSSALLFFFLFFLLRLILRKDWIAAAAFVSIFAAAGLAGNYPVVDTIFNFVLYAGVIFILKRFGLLPLVMFFLTDNILREGILTTNLSAWYAGPVYYVVFSTLALAIYGFHVSLAGRPIFSGIALDD